MTEKAGKEERTWAMLCHLSPMVGYLLPLGNIILPLLIWKLKKSEFPLVEDQGKESLNFQINLTLYFLFLMVLSQIEALAGFAMVVFSGLAIFMLVILVIAAIRANRGERYRYPYTIEFV